MKKLSVFVATGLMLLIGCSAEKSEQAASAEPDVADAEESTTREPVGYFEYLWCEAGENYNDETIAALVAEWNSITDGLNARVNGAFAYLPREWEDENFDGLWVLRWNDKAHSEAGWAEYEAAGADALIQANHPGVLTCGNEPGVNRFGFNGYIPREIPSSFDLTTEGPYFLMNQFCAFNDGKGGLDLREAVMGQYIPLLDEIGQENPGSSYWFRIGVPDFEPNAEQPMSFNWINFWQTAEEGAQSTAAYNASEEGQNMTAAFDAIATCTDPQPWNGIVLRAPDSI